MQDVLPIEDSSTMTEQRIDLNMLSRIDSEQKATASRVDSIDESLRKLDREVSEIKGAIKPPAETPSWIRFFVYPVCVLAASSMVVAVITLLVKVNGIETFVHDNGGFIAGLRLQQNAIDPTAPQGIADTKHVLDMARARRIKIPSDVISSTGAKFIEAAEKEPEAWAVAQDYLGYRSFLNAEFTPKPKDLTPIAGSFDFSQIHFRAVYPPQTGRTTATGYFSGGRTTPENSARLTQLNDGKTSLNVGLIVLDGPPDLALILDNLYMKNVILRNLGVVYDGGSLVMQNVSFVNCRFYFRATQRSRDLGLTLLASASVNFNARNQPVSGL